MKLWKMATRRDFVISKGRIFSPVFHREWRADADTALGADFIQILWI